MRFPIFVLMKDSGEVIKFTTLDAMQHDLEAIDIENHEYLAWDADGTALELGTQKPVWIKIEEKASDRNSLLKAIRAFAVSKGVHVNNDPSSLTEVEELLESITHKKR